MTETIDCEYTIEGDGPPLFLIHGIGAARDTWRYMTPLLNRYFTVVSYDLRGHGTSPMPDGEFGLDELVNDLERVRERTGIERAHFAGHSLGGMIGPACARQYPRHFGLRTTAPKPKVSSPPWRSAAYPTCWRHSPIVGTPTTSWNRIPRSCAAASIRSSPAIPPFFSTCFGSTRRWRWRPGSTRSRRPRWCSPARTTVGAILGSIARSTTRSPTPNS
ncbi:MAG: alpha/beta fold hydrolase [Acidimicrobiales bacterium]